MVVNYACQITALCVSERLEQLIDFHGVLQNIDPLETPPLSSVFFLVVLLKQHDRAREFFRCEEN